MRAVFLREGSAGVLGGSGDTRAGAAHGLLGVELASNLVKIGRRGRLADVLAGDCGSGVLEAMCRETLALKLGVEVVQRNFWASSRRGTAVLGVELASDLVKVGGITCVVEGNSGEGSGGLGGREQLRPWGRLSSSPSCSGSVRLPLFRLSSSPSCSWSPPRKRKRTLRRGRSVLPGVYGGDERSDIVGGEARGKRGCCRREERGRRRGEKTPVGSLLGPKSSVFFNVYPGKYFSTRPLVRGHRRPCRIVMTVVLSLGREIALQMRGTARSSLGRAGDMAS